MTVLRCCGGCSCPSHQPDKIPGAVQPPCCRCDYDEGIKECPADSPHVIHGRLPGPAGACGCECDPGRAGQKGSYTATFDDNGVMTANDWSGECPANVPTFNSGKCACECTLDSAKCAPKEFISETCECVCTKTDADCTAPNPVLDSETCECGPCTLTCNAPSAPDLDEDECECKCNKDDPNGGNSCPANLPDLDSATCSCECNVTADDCGRGTEFKSETCSCEPCPLPCPENKVRDNVGCGCACPQPIPTCGANETFDDATCSCVPSYAASLLNIDLLP